MQRAPLRLLVIIAGVVGCGPGESARPVFPLGEEALPPPSERCFRERTEEGGKPVERHLRLRIDPSAHRVTRHAAERGAPAAAGVVTVMDVDSARFTSRERGPGGEASGEGLLTGKPWAWTSWTEVIHRPQGDEHIDVTFNREGAYVVREQRGANDAVVSTTKQKFLAANCTTITDAPVETLYPEP